MVLICCINAVVIRRHHKRQSCNIQQVINDIPTVSTPQSNESRQPKTSSPPLPTRNPVVKTFNEGTPFNIEDNPAYQLASIGHGGCQPRYYNMGGTSFK